MKPGMKTYLVTDGTAYKIGRTLSPEQRLVNMQNGNPRELRIVSVLEGDFEYELHGLFACYHVRDEWFSLAPEIREEFLLRDGRRQLEAAA